MYSSSNTLPIRCLKLHITLENKFLEIIDHSLIIFSYIIYLFIQVLQKYIALFLSHEFAYQKMLHIQSNLVNVLKQKEKKNLCLW